MATDTVKKRKPQGPRKVKPKTLYIAVKGTIEEMKVLDSAEDVIDLQEANPGAYRIVKHTLPMKVKAPAATTA